MRAYSFPSALRSSGVLLLLVALALSGACGSPANRANAGTGGMSHSGGKTLQAQPCRSNAACPSGHRCGALPLTGEGGTIGPGGALGVLEIASTSGTAGATDPPGSVDAAGAPGVVGTAGISGIADIAGTSGRAGTAGASEMDRGTKTGDAPEGLHMCSNECFDSLCGDHEECSSPQGYCNRVTCGRTIDCPATAEALYCSVTDDACYRTSGFCGLVGTETRGCPQLSRIPKEGVRVMCDRPDSTAEGRCKFDVGLSCPADPGTVNDIDFEVDAAWDNAFASVDAAEFRYWTPEAHFIYVTNRIPDHVAEIDQNAIWAAALPSVPVGQANRTVRFADGFRVSDGIWLNELASPELGVTLYAMVYAVRGLDVTHASSKVLTFRIGDPFPSRGMACNVSIATDNLTKGDGLAECKNPALFMACVDRKCRALCLSNQDDQCLPSEDCVLQRELGIRVCLPNSSAEQ